MEPTGPRRNSWVEAEGVAGSKASVSAGKQVRFLFAFFARRAAETALGPPSPGNDIEWV